MSGLTEAIDRALKEQTDKELVIETIWQLYAATVKIPPGGVQWVESRRCFFAGASTLFECILRIMDPGTEPTENDLGRMDHIARELERYRHELEQRLV